MHRLVTITTISLLASCGNVEPEGAPSTTPHQNQTAAEEPQDPRACTRDQDCVALRHTCLTEAVNRAFEEERLEELRTHRSDCPPPPGGRWLAPAAKCNRGRCSVVAAEAAVTLPSVEWDLEPCDSRTLRDALGDRGEAPLRLSVFHGTTSIGEVVVARSGETEIEEFDDNAPEELAARLLRLVADANAQRTIRFRFLARPDRGGAGGVACVGQAEKGDAGYPHAVRHHIRTYQFNVRILDEQP